MSEAEWSQAEQYAARQNGLERTGSNRGDKAETWHDAVDPATNQKHQIKSAQEGRRFRLWEQQHRSLTASAGQLDGAYYLFVVSGKPILKVDARTVTEWVRDRGGWNKAGHSGRPGDRQLKIPEQWVYDRVEA